jgi:hypothetical protein
MLSDVTDMRVVEDVMGCITLSLLCAGEMKMLRHLHLRLKTKQIDHGAACKHLH